VLLFKLKRLTKEEGREDLKKNDILNSALTFLCKKVSAIRSKK
jgi:hypothetical protein